MLLNIVQPIQVVTWCCTEREFASYNFLNISFNNSDAALIQTNIKQFQSIVNAQRLHEMDHSLQKEHPQLLARNQVLIKFLNSLVFWAVVSN